MIKATNAIHIISGHEYIYGLHPTTAPGDLITTAGHDLTKQRFTHHCITNNAKQIIHHNHPLRDWYQYHLLPKLRNKHPHTCQPGK